MTSLQDEYDDAMATADVAVRQFERELEKLRLLLAAAQDSLAAENPKAMANALDVAAEKVRGLVGHLQSPDLTAWRGEKGARENARRQQQEVLTRKLFRAKELLLDAGWDLDRLEADLKATSPDPQERMAQSRRERGARRRIERARAVREAQMGKSVSNGDGA